MTHLAVLSKGNGVRPAAASTKQDGSANVAYVLELGLVLAEMFFIAKDSAGAKAEP